MSSKKVNYMFLFVLIILGIGYFLSAMNLENSPMSQGAGLAGPGKFPMFLAISLIVLCLISLFQVSRKEDKKITVPNLKFVLFTLAMITIFYLSWFFIGLFYVNLFLLLIIMMIVYTQKSERKKLMLNNLVLSICITGLVYLIFKVILQISL